MLQSQRVWSGHLGLEVVPDSEVCVQVKIQRFLSGRVAGPSSGALETHALNQAARASLLNQAEAQRQDGEFVDLQAD